MEIEGQDACVCMHTALRKYCDSKITSVAYNLIHLIDIRPIEQCAWHMLGDMVAEGINGGDKPLAALKKSIKHLNKKFFETVIRPLHDKGKRTVENAQTVLHALECVLKCFSEEELKGMVYLLNE